MISPEHQALIDACNGLLSSWNEEKSKLERNAAVDRKVGLPHTAEVEECSALAIEGCMEGLRNVLTPKGDNPPVP